ncbi:D-2-hydroxyacid dehydrogenase [Hoyosella subflava]|uniref:Putative D-isomer specific 2-hydroxyacid dehydrogenase n=1 Tax=Hoyosella subflava (strain DSM 45089 / JCM 17490 / NBRC 109087 / DQS3-9A1) TaxID=443218 RepID=F6EKX2_HOYSD|nr:D-2-hydroxyacid dehydrogenase [Hoyosella subflava]AEF41452.1 Putative D-isomer specific 2-hydroxyacid dehydrogenase [Hoyosella subflava DQS3-9A1]
MTTAAERTRPIVAVLYREALPPRLAEIEELSDVRLTTADGLAKALDGADVLYQWHSFSPALRENWDAAASLRWVHVSAAGVSQLLFDELIRSDIAYTNSRGVLSRAIAEFALGFVLDMAKDAQTSFRLQQQHRWRHRTTRKLQGQSALVVGTGSIGREIARLFEAVGIEVSGAGRSSRSGDGDFRQIHSSRDLASVVRDYDYLVLAAPLTPETRGLVSAQVLASMKPTASLINVGRGELVDTDALTGALASAGIAGAALDVVHPEPLPEGHALWGMDNVIITPHMSGDTDDYLDDLGQLFVDNLRRYCNGAPLQNVVDKALGFVSA